MPDEPYVLANAPREAVPQRRVQVHCPAAGRLQGQITVSISDTPGAPPDDNNGNNWCSRLCGARRGSRHFRWAILDASEEQTASFNCDRDSNGLNRRQQQV
jgi:hypothetical protein